MAQVYLSIGSNIQREKNIRAGLDALFKYFGKLDCSPVYESVAVGFAGANFYNLVVSFDTKQKIAVVAQILRDIEDQQQRVRDGVKFSSRTLDLDLILYDDLVSNEGHLQIPRDEIEKYAFVLQPLADIAPTKCHPVLKRSYADMWAAFDADKVAQFVVDCDWQP
ncbi:2-amino-4-hydroxy-6-hydroxymethyldihydropteridine diphosphokinase [Gammaproteobacteria bacterium AH-315-M22]|nr:2-amino-4-hydroxy-6-hydroxymethyldihydropteridine diphosphokinase [Gammaproteobacteria bacterium AH-315-M22]